MTPGIGAVSPAAVVFFSANADSRDSVSGWAAGVGNDSFPLSVAVGWDVPFASTIGDDFCWLLPSATVESAMAVVGGTTFFFFFSFFFPWAAAAASSASRFFCAMDLNCRLHTLLVSTFAFDQVHGSGPSVLLPLPVARIGFTEYTHFAAQRFLHRCRTST